MTEAHKKKLSESKIKYYTELKKKRLKRPYKRIFDTGNIRTRFPETIKIIELFNEVLRNEGQIDEKTINLYLYKEKQK